MFNVQISKISLNFPAGSNAILCDCNFTIEPSKTYILLGSNGSGKSTLLNTAAGIINKNLFAIEGDVTYKNISLLNTDNDILTKVRREEIKYIFQDPVLTFDPLKKIGYYFEAPEINNSQAGELLEYFLLPPFQKIKNLYPHEISAGMAQRIALVLAILAAPALYIMDEPTSALDLASSNLLSIKIKDLTTAGASFLIATQDIPFAEKTGDLITEIKNKSVPAFTEKSLFFGGSI